MQARIIQPHQTSARDKYCRLFPPGGGGLTHTVDGQLRQLVLSMAGSSPVPIAASPLRDRIPAAYTYFGQFIDHDLTCEGAASPEPSSAGTRIEPSETTNHRTEFLQLQSLYGGGPGSAASQHLYVEDGASFRVGAVGGNERVCDMPLSADGKPQAADPRNIENAIVRQIHAIFLQLHNHAVAEFTRELGNRSIAPAGERFAYARRRVVQQFQWLVRHYFLPNICDKATADAVLARSAPFIKWRPNEFSIPVEFSQAAFRFGHSMVKSRYRLGGGRQLELREIFGGFGSTGALPAAHVVDWNEFLGKAGGLSQFANLIDTALVNDLFNVPGHRIAACAAGAGLPPDGIERSLPLRTLRRGAASRLASGETARELMCGDAESSGFLNEDAARAADAEDPRRHLRASGMLGSSPLFYYILLEAELEQRGNRLGTLGSRIVAGTLEGALRADRESIAAMPAGEELKPWRARDGSEIRIRTFSDLVRVVGLL